MRYIGTTPRREGRVAMVNGRTILSGEDLPELPARLFHVRMHPYLHRCTYYAEAAKETALGTVLTISDVGDNGYKKNKRDVLLRLLLLDGPLVTKPLFATALIKEYREQKGDR